MSYGSNGPHTTLDDVAKGLDIAASTIPVVLVLVTAIHKIMNSGDNRQAQLDALMDAAEAVKLRLDELKFPEESKRV